MCQYDTKELYGFVRIYGDLQGAECSPLDPFHLKMSKLLFESFISFICESLYLHIAIHNFLELITVFIKK